MKTFQRRKQMTKTWKSIGVVAVLGLVGLAVSMLSERAEAQQIPSLSKPLFPNNYEKNPNPGLATSSIRSQAKVVVETANYTLAATDYETEFTNTGATSAVQFNLPACTAANLGYRDTFSITANQNILVATTAGNTFATPALTGTTHTLLTSNNVPGGSVTVTCNNPSGVWRANATATSWASN
jgi:hypothetical protein